MAANDLFSRNFQLPPSLPSGLFHFNASHMRHPNRSNLSQEAISLLPSMSVFALLCSPNNMDAYSVTLQ